MSTENLDGIYSYPAAADLSANQYQFASVNTSLEAALTAAGALPDGLLHNLPKAGEMARLVHLRGVVVKAKVGAGGVTAGAVVCVGAAGIVVSATSGHIRIGKALKAGAAGDIIEMLYLGYMGANP